MRTMITLMQAQRISLLTLAVATLAFLVIGSSLQLSFAPGPDPNAKARAIQDGVSLDGETEGIAGADIDCVGGIASSADADTITCYLIPEGVPTPNYDTDPSVIQQDGAPIVSCPSGVGFGSSDDCFSTTFSGALFTEGDYRFLIEFKKAGEVIDLAGVNWRNHTFLVIPESPIGAAALILSSLAALGGFMFLRGRKRESMMNF